MIRTSLVSLPAVIQMGLGLGLEVRQLAGKSMQSWWDWFWTFYERQTIHIHTVALVCVVYSSSVAMKKKEDVGGRGFMDRIALHCMETEFGQVPQIYPN